MPSPATKSKDPAIQAQSQLVRFIESNLKIKTDDPVELKFRASLIRKVIATLPVLNATFLARISEAVAGVEFAKADVIELRKHLNKAIGRALNLSEYAAPALERPNKG